MRQASSRPLPWARNGQRPHGVAQALAQVERRRVQLQLAGLDLGEVQDVVEQRQQRLARVLDHLQVLALGSVKVACPAPVRSCPMMAFMGVRISWLMLARNSLLARLAASAASLAARSASAPLPSVMSREMPKVPITWPWGSRSGSLVDEHQVTWPSSQLSFSILFNKGRPLCMTSISSTRACWRARRRRNPRPICQLPPTRHAARTCRPGPC